MGNVPARDNVKEKHIYTVSEINRYIRMILEDSFPAVWIEGEITNFVLHSSGHMYFSLRDAGSVLKCAMFKRSNEKLKFRPKDGMKVIAFGKISVYDVRGDYQLIIEEIEPKGIGALQLQFEELKKALAREGLFDASHKVPIPYLPTKIGIVTSPTGAAIRDILNIARRRFSNVEIIINPVKVQGADAPKEISEAVKQFNRLNNVDVIIVTRGGGSLEDLWSFNEEVVARAIYASEIPVISAVGHEIDYTISDFAADFRAPTPSAAAELVIPRKEDLTGAINAFTERLKNALTSRLDIFSHRLNTLKDSYIMRQPMNLVLQYGQRIDDLVKDISVTVEHIVKMRQENFRLLVGKLSVLSPLAILSRGYSVTTKLPEGIILKGSRSVRKGDRVKTRLGDGQFTSIVEEANG